MQPEALAEIAARSFIRAQAAARKAIAAGRMQPSEADSRMLPWLAIAAAGGAKLPELIEPLDVIVHTGPAPAPTSRRRHSSEISPRADWVPVLVETREAALARHEAEPGEENTRTARDLIALGDALAFTGEPTIPPVQPKSQERKAA